MTKQLTNTRSRIRRLRIWTIITAAAFGAAAVALARLGNPPNMGICSACFERDFAGGLGLFSGADAARYLRPEVPGFILGACAAALLFGEIRSRGGSSPLLRFVIGALVMIGALVFLGCPIRTLERIAGGDWASAGAGFLGVLTGAAAGSLFIRRGFSLGASRALNAASAWVVPLLAAGGAALVLAYSFGYLSDLDGRMQTKYAAPVLTALAIAVGVGFFSQRSGWCSVGGYRDSLLWRDHRLLFGYAVFMAVLVAGNLLVDRFWPGSRPMFDWGAYPLAHSVHAWNFLGMFVVGLGSILIGGCPFRQLIAAGQGSSDAAMAVMGLLFGAAVSHNFGLTAAPDAGAIAGGPEFAGKAAVLGGAAFLILIGAACKAEAAPSRDLGSEEPAQAA